MNFDEYAADYDSALEQGISISGENKDYFSQTRIAWLARCLQKSGNRPERITRILDYGCGTGSGARFLLELSPDVSVVGVDVSNKSLDVARRHAIAGRMQFLLQDDYIPQQNIDLAFCSGVFHHIPPSERLKAIRYVYESLRPGGLFAVWENNPWNPGTRFVMSRIPFDRNAVPVSAPETVRLLRQAGFGTVRIDFLFIFPRIFRHLRFLEPAVSRLPLGAQYQVLCRKPLTR